MWWGCHRFYRCENTQIENGDRIDAYQDRSQPLAEGGKTEAEGTEAAGSAKAGTATARTEAVGTEAVGTEVVGTEAVGTEAFAAEVLAAEVVATEAFAAEAKAEEAEEVWALAVAVRTEELAVVAAIGVVAAEVGTMHNSNGLMR